MGGSPTSTRGQTALPRPRAAAAPNIPGWPTGRRWPRRAARARLPPTVTSRWAAASTTRPSTICPRPDESVLTGSTSPAQAGGRGVEAAKDSAEQAKAAAELANRAKDHFLAVLSHELRTPLTPVVMGMSMLRDEPDFDPDVRDTLEMVRRNVEMEARLIDDLLDVTRIARGKIELQPEAVELCTVINRAVEVCKPDIEARRLHFGVDLGPAAPYWVEADVARLQQVFWNLLEKCDQVHAARRVRGHPLPARTGSTSWSR